MSTVRDLVDALASGSTMDIDKTFNDVMAVKVTSALDDYKSKVAQSMFVAPEAAADVDLEQESENEV